MTAMKLVFEKGPRIGEFRPYNPRSKVRIGRVVKGNNLTIKDDAISSQHLTIHFDSGLGKWVITDLDSSNGTHLNSLKLKPFSPSELNNSDEIKIGDSTSIRVEIAEEICDVRKKPKVGVADEVCPDLVEGGSVRVHEVGNLKTAADSGLNLGIENPKGRGRGRAKKESNATLIPNVVEDVKPKQEQKMATRSTRNSRRATDELLCLEKVVPVRKTRGRKKKEELENSKNVKDNTVAVDVSQLEVPQEPIGDTIQQYPLVDEVIEDASQLKIANEEEEVHEVSMGNTIQETPLEDTRNETLNKEVSEAFMGGEKDHEASASHFGQDACERIENDMVLEGGEVEVEEIDEVLNTEIDEGEKEHKFDTLPDLEKMTLGDWFDYLKVSLPMQIYAARDETIRHMRERAERFDEFMLQEEKEKGK